VITKYGIGIVVKVVLLLLIAGGIVWLTNDGSTVRWTATGLLLVILGLVLNFFRDPDRTTPTGDNFVISPADGRVVVIREVEEGEFLRGTAQQVSIFMSPLNVHVNRFPISGKVQYFKHLPGKFLAAFEEKSSEANERTLIGIDHGKFKVLMKQIAGYVARRIVADVTVGMDVVAGERFGMIKFGSRVDVIVPMTFRVRVRLNEHVVAGETIIAAAN